MNFTGIKSRNLSGLGLKFDHKKKKKQIGIQKWFEKQSVIYFFLNAV